MTEIGDHVSFQVLVHDAGPRRYFIGEGIIEKVYDHEPTLTPTGRLAKTQLPPSIRVRADANYWVPGVLVEVAPAMGDAYRTVDHHTNEEGTT